MPGGFWQKASHSPLQLRPVFGIRASTCNSHHALLEVNGRPEQAQWPRRTYAHPGLQRRNQ
eukprot:7024630-Alexandrium_andersonii.AAC.1